MQPEINFINYMKHQSSILNRWAHAVGGNPKHWLFYYDYIFRKVDFHRKNVLDIGGGAGRSAFYAAARGASRVVCIEPELDGSHSGMLRAAASIGDQLGLRDVVKFVTKPVQDAGLIEQFDVVMMLNSINHLEEDACIRLRDDIGARNIYAGLLRQISDLTSLGGTLLITDCSNENLFGSRSKFGWYNPFAPTIEYWKHQKPELWIELFRNEGFGHPDLRWTPDRRSGMFGERWLTSRVASYCLQSHFCLTLTKDFDPRSVAVQAI
jgi:SAM-dependent methyltransferase